MLGDNRGENPEKSANNSDFAAENLAAMRAQIEAACARSGRAAEEVTLVGASKTVAPEVVCAFYEAGLRDVGENYVQEALQKQGAWAQMSNGSDDLRWHFIGALQSNKARDVVGRFGLIHSVDRLSLANELDKAARKAGVVQDVLLQVNIAGEATKAGCAPVELPALWEACAQLSNLRPRGLMCLPPYEADLDHVRRWFRQMRQLGESVQGQLPAGERVELSMGMTHDFAVAIEEGATIIRVGTGLFGKRRYN